MGEQRDHMSDDAFPAIRDLPNLSRLPLRELRVDADGALDQALRRVLAEDEATTEASAGFQNRL
jgi:FXSXX-COOH protein